jgi:hypothetical protein
MKGKVMFVVGAAVGYVVGTRAGRQGYERLKSQASDLWLNPKVQDTVESVGDLAKDKIPVVGGAISDASKKITGRARAGAAAVADTTDE